jgi:hypothetical protein
MTLFPYCADIILCISTPGTPSADKNGSLPSALLWCKRNWECPCLWQKNSWHKWTIKVTPAPQERSRPYTCILSCPASSIANCKTCTYSADNFRLTYVRTIMLLHVSVWWNHRQGACSLCLAKVTYAATDRTFYWRNILTDINIVTSAKHRLQAPWWWFHQTDTCRNIIVHILM